MDRESEKKGENQMKKILALVVSVVIVGMFFTTACSKEKQEKQGEGMQGEMKPIEQQDTKIGEELFKMNCAVCHPNGENVINKEKTLHKEDLDEFGVKTPDDIVKLMRNPGPGMRKFDENVISDKDAREIANYVLKAFQ
jgi:cytochrome c6